MAHTQKWALGELDKGTRARRHSSCLSRTGVPFIPFRSDGNFAVFRSSSEVLWIRDTFR